MWFLGSHKHHKEYDNESSKHSTESPQERPSKRRSRVRKLGRNKSSSKSNRTTPNQVIASVTSTPESSIVDQDSMHLAETYSGIEVSLHDEKGGGAPVEQESAPFFSKRRNTAKRSTEDPLRSSAHAASTSTTTRENSPLPAYKTSSTAAAIISMQQHAALEVQKVYSAQFNVSKWSQKNNSTNLNVTSNCINGTASNNGKSSSSATISISNSNNSYGKNGVTTTTIDFKARPHRIPLFSEQKEQDPMLFDDMVYLLTNQPVLDEETVVQRELDCMDSELSLLELDRIDIEKLARDHQQSTITINGESATSNSKNQGSWDLHQQLLIGGTSSASASSISSPATAVLSKAERIRLQEQRGLNLTIQLQNPYAQEAFLAKCGCLQKMPYQTPVTVGPHNCRDGGGAATIQHVQLIQSSATPAMATPTTQPTDSSTANAFLLSRDAGQSFCSIERGGLPDRLYRRLREEEASASNILYLVTGPHDSYYAEFRSGECWWGCPDAEFGRLCRDWDVHRVGFGPAKEMWVPSSTTSPSSNTNSSQPQQQRRVVCLSWLIVSRDGRAAWKNLPARLHSQLSRRLASEPAPVEFALGAGDSYFVRWMDGTSDWQLSAAAAAVCERLEKHAPDSTIMSVALHPSSAQDFVIRHRIVHQSRVV